MTKQCRCATECEWLPEQYKLEHHPGCQAKRIAETIIETHNLIDNAASVRGTLTLVFPINDDRVPLFLNTDEGELNLSNGNIKLRCHWTKVNQSLDGTIADTFARFELFYRILDVLAPPLLYQCPTNRKSV